MSDYPAIMRSRYRKAGIPVRMHGLLADHDVIQQIADSCRPEGVVRGYLKAFSDGKVLRAEGQYRTCGRGLWVRSGEDADVLSAAILQTLLLRQDIESGTYISVFDFIESETPTAESMGDTLFSDLIVLQGLGAHYKSQSGWSDSVLLSFLRRRFDRGLPTVVTSDFSPDQSGLPESFLRMAFTEVVVGGVSEE